MDGAHIGSDKTLRENLIRLRAVGLLDWSGDIGTHGGNTYTVFLPEEVQFTEETPATLATLGSHTNPGYPGYFLPWVPRVESTLGSRGLVVDNKATYEDAKTLFKTNTENDDDDAALAALNETLRQAAKEITGKEISPAESERWRELAEVLVAELKMAAARTTVSNVPAFLAEHLRRRLWKLDKKQAREEGRELPDEAMKMKQGMDGSKCAECGGTGWHYPEGMEKGVRKCRHEKVGASRENER